MSKYINRPTLKYRHYYITNFSGFIILYTIRWLCQVLTWSCGNGNGRDLFVAPPLVFIYPGSFYCQSLCCQAQTLRISFGGKKAKQMKHIVNTDNHCGSLKSSFLDHCWRRNLSPWALRWISVFILTPHGDQKLKLQMCHFCSSRKTRSCLVFFWFFFKGLNHSIMQRFSHFVKLWYCS